MTPKEIEQAVDDIVVNICDLNDKDANKENSIPMYSFDRPAFMFWLGMIEGLLESGLTKEETIWWLQSKMARWKLDDMDQKIKRLGRETGLDVDPEHVREFKKG